jgi:hypothetical protein
MRRIVGFILLFGGFPCVVTASAKHMPLAPSLMQAKRVYIDNQTPDCPECADQAYGELSKWGRFQVVSEPKGADLIFVLKSTSTERPIGVVANTTSNTATSSQTSGTVISHEDYTVYLSVLDANTNQTLYSNGEYWRFAWSKPAATLVKDLRKRIDDQERGSKQ